MKAPSDAVVILGGVGAAVHDLARSGPRMPGLQRFGHSARDGVFPNLDANRSPRPFRRVP